MTKLDLSIENVMSADIPNTARIAHYLGVVAQINGSLIDSVKVDGSPRLGPEMTSPDGRNLVLGANALPTLRGGSPTAIAAWCGAALHGFAHSRYSPRTTEPLRATLAQKKLHRTWNMIEDARIERLLLADFPGWTLHLMGAVNYILLRSQPGAAKKNLSGVYPLLVGRTYLPAALRQDAYEAFADENSEYIADAVRDLIFRYMTLVDPGSADHDETVEIVTRLASLLGRDVGTECGSHTVEENVERQWTDPGDPSEDDDDDTDDADGDDDDTDPSEDDDDADDDGNQVVTDDGDDDGESTDGDDDDGGDADPGDTDDGDGEGDGDTDGDDDGDDGEGGGSGDDGEADDDGEPGPGSGEGDDEDQDGDAEGHDDESGEDADDEADGGEGGLGEGGGGTATSRLVDWMDAIDSALAEDERLNDLREAIVSGPMPQLRLAERKVVLAPVNPVVQLAEQDIARELRVLMDGARPGMKRRIDRGRFNVARVVREGGSTRPEEMFDRHDPGAVRSTGCAVAILGDVSGSMRAEGLTGVSESIWAIDRAVQSVRGAFKAWTFGSGAYEMPRSESTMMNRPEDMDGQTQPLLALSAAQGWLSQQREPNKLCIIATDGAWDGSIMCHEIMASLIETGVQVAVFGINTRVDQHARTGAMTRRIQSAADLGPAVGEMLVNRVKSALHR